MGVGTGNKLSELIFTIADFKVVADSAESSVFVEGNVKI